MNDEIRDLSSSRRKSIIFGSSTFTLYYHCKINKLNFRPALVKSALIFFLSWHLPATASTPAIIEDVSDKWSFLNMGNTYTDGKYKYVCVETQHGNWQFWNPVLNSISKHTSKLCRPPATWHGVDVRVSYAPLPGLPDTGITNYQNFADGSTLFQGSLSEYSDCFPVLYFFYTMRKQGQPDESFYFLAKLAKHKQVSSPSKCMPSLGKQTISVDFEEVMVNSTDLGNGRALIYYHDDNYYTKGRVILFLSGIPTYIWTSKDNTIYIIPKNYVDSRTRGKELNASAVYSALLQTIHQSSVAPKS